MAPTISIRIFGDVCILYEGQREGHRRCAAFSRSVRWTAGLGIAVTVVERQATGLFCKNWISAWNLDWASPVGSTML